jgi:membrane-bound lytic murein transglycosylase D
MIRTRSTTALSALAVVFAFVLPASAFANATALGPDMPAWTIHPTAGYASDRTSDIEDEETVPVPDPLDPILANVARAQDLIDSGHPSEALATIDAALLALDSVPNSRQGVSAVRENLANLRERCEKMSSSGSGLPTDDGADGTGTIAPQLRSVKAERNDRVDKWMDFFTGRGRDQFQMWLVRSGGYMELLTHNLRAEGVPEELANLVFVESGFNMHARSVARAVGPWQFIRGTAKIFGLKMTPYVDQRRDPELSTRAAARYLRRLYGIFDGNWPLAIAAYNSGEGTVQRAVRRQRTDDFWSLRLPRETQEYVPQFLAVMEIASDPERYGFELPPNSPFRFDEVLIRGPVDLKLVSGITSIPLDDLQQLNPSLVRHRMPAGAGGTAIRVPKGKGDEVQELLLTSYKPKPMSKTELREASLAQRQELRHHPRRHRGRHNTHTVRRGETLSEIGKRYGKTPASLARLNRISDSGQVRAGQRLRVQ